MIHARYSLLLLSFAICGCTTQDPAVYGNTALMQSHDFGAGAVVPPMESSRKVNEQDCGRSIDLTGGNLRCR